MYMYMCIYMRACAYIYNVYVYMVAVGWGSVGRGGGWVARRCPPFSGGHVGCCSGCGHSSFGACWGVGLVGGHGRVGARQ